MPGPMGWLIIEKELMTARPAQWRDTMGLHACCAPLFGHSD